MASAVESAIENVSSVGSSAGCRLAAKSPDTVDDSAVTLAAGSSGAPKRPRRGPITRYQRGDAVAAKYRLVRMLGSGGMGAVWVAHHLDLDVQVALKLIRADVDDDGLGQRFLSEARLLARIEHRAVVRILDFGRTEHGDPYIVMELLRGEDLRSAIERHVKMPPNVAVSSLLPVAEGLVAAHARQIVHRDLKPDNIFLAEVGRSRQPKILDFGIARCLAAHSDIHVTGSGCVVGSPEYMAPEQAQGREDIDHRADVWGFCSVLYECITGQRPFAFEGNYEKLLRRIIDDPVPTLADYGIDEPALDAILQRGFEKNREDRWQTMDEVATALARWLLDQGESEDACGTSLRAAWLRPEQKSADLIMVSSSDGRNASPWHLPAPRLRAKSSIAGLVAMAAMGAVLFALRGPQAEARDAMTAAQAVPMLQRQAEVARSEVQVETAAANPSSGVGPSANSDHKASTLTASSNLKNTKRRATGAHRTANAAPSSVASVEAPPAPTATTTATNAGLKTHDSVELFYENLGF